MTAREVPPRGPPDDAGDPGSDSPKPRDDKPAWLRRERLVSAAQVIAEVAAGPQGPGVIAAFDFDGTLVGGLTGAMLLEERVRRRDVDLAELAGTANVTLKALARLHEVNKIVTHSMAQWAGKTEQEMEELAAHLFEHRVQDEVFPEMRAILAAHRAAGHTIVVATSASRFQVEAAVAELGIEHLLCTEVEVVDGKLTGELVGGALFGPGKVAAIERFVAERGANLSEIHFYADGNEEVELMELVGHPHPVNPARQLAEAARINGWPVLRLKSRGGAGPKSLARGMAGLMSIMPILQADMMTGGLARDKRRRANLIAPAWLKAQFALAGVKLRVQGRPNLTAVRPAVFVFNHRNSFDGWFVASLVATDFVMCAEQEIAQSPLGKLIASVVPTILTDPDGAKGAETVAQASDCVAQGRSVIVAPEGTRVRGSPNSVGPFRKEALQIAIAAGVPIVPVVIRNALDVASRQGALRPGTVDIAVLPPIPVDGWTAAKLARKTRELRQAFVDTLANWPELDQTD